MVPRLSDKSARSDGRGRSFKSLSAYLFQGDRDAANPERAAWAEALNCHCSDPADAWQEMAWTWEHSDELKKAAGVRSSGQRNDHPVWHVSLNWHADDAPSRQEMRDAALGLLKRFGLEDHQALMVAHEDTDHPHLHLMVNLVNPYDGRTVDVSRSTKMRLSGWAREYDREHGREHCPQREINFQKRQANRAAYHAAREFAIATGQEVAPLQVTRDDSPKRGLWNIIKQARGTGLDDDGVAQLRELHRGMWRGYFVGKAQDHATQGDDPAASILARLTRLQATFTRQDLAALVSAATKGTDDFTALLARIEGGGEVVALPGEGGRLSTQTMIRTEAEMVASADAMAARQDHGISRSGERTRDRAKHLNAEQKAALDHVTQADGIASVVGYAGTGKSTLLGEARKVWEASGYRVRGAALSGIAAEGLQSGSGIKSTTLKSLDMALEGRDPLTSKDVLVIDEAGMIGSRQMHALLTKANAAGAKVVLVGDPHQLQAIEAGGAFRAVLDRTGTAVVTTIMRQREAWQRQATKDLADGRTAAALAAYEGAGMMQAHGTKADAIRNLAHLWAADRISDPGASSIILAATRKDVAALNAEARTIVRSAGGIAGDDVTINACLEEVDKPRVDFRLKVALGERLLFTKNDNRLGVKNGTLGTLEAARNGRLTVTIDGEKPRRIEVDLAAYRNLAYGYAVTVHKAQGVTVDRAHVLAGRSMDRHSAYVALSRHRDSVTMHYSQDDFRDRQKLDRTLSRNRPKETTLDYLRATPARTLKEERSEMAGRFSRLFNAAKTRSEERSTRSWMVGSTRDRDTSRKL